MDIFISTIIWIVIMFLFSFLDKTVSDIRRRIAIQMICMFVFQYFMYLK